jgi:hypothetical protein
MKTVVIKNYIQGLASFLDEKGIEWKTIGDSDSIEIYFTNDEELFLLGFEFGKFYEKN